MKPQFALSLSFDGIGLLLRNGAVWDRVGEVPLDIPDLPDALDLLRQTAQDLSDAPLQVKLLLPAEQIKYLRLADPGGDDAIRAEAVRHALDGTTPYSLDELAYDWALEKGELTIAAVAHETLEEAEGFAKGNGFEPVYFTARPEPGQFAGEPFFGQTKWFSGQGAKLERDSAAVEIGGVASKPELELRPETQKPETQQPEPPATEPETLARAEPLPAFSTRRAPAPESPAAPESAAAPKLSGVTRHEPRAVGGTIEIPDVGGDALAPLQKPAPESSKSEGGMLSFFSRRAANGEAKPAKPAPHRVARTSPPPMPPPNVIPPAASEKQRLTVFGARKPEPMMVAEKSSRGPRFLGLIFTAVLLLFLIGVGAWAAIFTEEGLSSLFGRKEPEAIVLAPNEPDELTIEGEEAMVPETAIELAALDTALPGIDARPEPVPPSQMSLAEAQEKYAVTGIWALAPSTPPSPGTDNLDDFYVPSIDAAIDAKDAVALPQIVLLDGDDGVRRHANPAPQGQRFILDGRGLVKATPDGALTQDGHLAYLGKPPVGPRSWPERTAPREDPAAEAEKNRLASIRPKARPKGLVEAQERAKLGGRSREELAALRPKPRPRSIQSIAAEAARKEAEAAAKEAAAAEAAKQAEAQAKETEAQAQAAAAAAAIAARPTGPDIDPNTTPQAVRKSIKPKTRPHNFSRIVKRAEQQTARQQPKETERVARVSAPRTVQPRVPSRATVAKQATQRNALRLRKVNLLGISGKPSSRRALVMLSNGRTKKLKVGDYIDGGRVSAISDTELLYKKNGRNVRLKMPRG